MLFSAPKWLEETKKKKKRLRATKFSPAPRKALAFSLWGRLANMATHVFLTGPPGIGKTTLVRKAAEILKSSGIPIDGFYTEEVRESGRRTGFDVVTLNGRRGILSRVGSGHSAARHEYRVGQYVVDLASFEQLALPLLRNITRENRDDILQEVVTAVQNCLK
ncbi:cancer-related nucleoside-triphosphatase isoform X2 [Ahaetulla prasina]|uniref:cancer-related nucleoside-triphosphatase isoform X2 n=1 Tax=Ahaetulla prasina TaxID=499056 RepID=UPI002647500A|nr:cancer-related nucleoside-triphosphatase isoform X2 [Ahaetulla prasina]